MDGSDQRAGQKAWERGRRWSVFGWVLWLSIKYFSICFIIVQMAF